MESTADRLNTKATGKAIAQERAVSLNWIAILRAMMGLVFLTTWFGNLNKGLYGDGYVPFIQGWADGTDVEWYAAILNNVVIPNADILRIVQIITEGLIMGVFLTVGLFTPISAPVSWFFVVNLFFASFGTGEWPWTYIMMGVVLAIIAVTRAGRVYGADTWLAEKWGDTRWPIY